MTKLVRTLRVLAVAPVVAVGVAAAAIVASGSTRRLGATREEAARALPGDKLLDRADLQADRAVTIAAPPERVWPWIAQLGQDKGGFYSFAWLENLVGCDIHNADRIVPAWQNPQVGDPFPLHPEMILTLGRVDEGIALVATSRGAPPPRTWAWTSRGRSSSAPYRGRRTPVPPPGSTSGSATRCPAPGCAPGLRW